MSEPVTPVIGDFQVNINDAVRPYPGGGQIEYGFDSNVLSRQTGQQINISREPRL